MTRCTRCNSIIIMGAIQTSDGNFCSETCEKVYKKNKEVKPSIEVKKEINNNGFPIKLTGNNGTLELYEDRIIMHRPGGFFSTQTAGNKTVLIKNITGVQLKPPDWITVGFIQFTIPGGKERLAGVIEAVKDENTITFLKEALPIAEKVRDYILKKSSEVPVAPMQAQAERTIISVADELKKFKELLDSEVISKEEFEEQKKKLLKM